MKMMLNTGVIVLRVFVLYFLWWEERRCFATATVAEISPGKEYCQNEVFSVECPSDSVVQILSADYGRMYVGRCVRKDYGFIGCRQSVLGIMDFFCGGRRACNVRVPNEHFDAAAQAACPEDFKFFLEVRYECIKVVHVTKPTCRSLHVRNEPEGAIASVVTMETDCGSDQLPWRIELLPGQRINVTLYDFVYASRELSRHQTSDAKCVAYAIFKEPNVVPSHTMCGGAERVSTGYVSVAEKVQIVIMKRSDAETHRYFVLKYTAIGCGHPVAPVGGWAMRVKDEAMFGCNYSAATWKLKCHGWKWVGGTPSNCTIPENTLGLTGTSLNQNLTFEMAVGAVVFIALIIASLILCIGILLIRRYGRSTKPILEMIPAGVGAMYDIDGGGGSDCIVRSANDLDRDSDQYRDLNDYAYIDSNQQIQGLGGHHCSRHGGAPSSSLSPDVGGGGGGHVICEISKQQRETSHPPSSRGQTPYSTLERNNETCSGTSPATAAASDWKAAAAGPVEGSINAKVSDAKKMEKNVKPPEWYHHSYSDSILSNSEPARRYSYQVKAILK